MAMIRVSVVCMPVISPKKITRIVSCTLSNPTLDP